MKRPLPFHSHAVWPPTLFVGLFVILYAMVAACLWLIDLSVPNNDQAMSDLREILNMRRGILLSAAGGYALYRLWRFHPACNQAYAAWLKLSPWTAAKPLPLGPIHLVWQDVFVIGLITAVGVWHAHIDTLLPVAVFGLVYLGGMTLLLALTRRWWFCLLLGFLWPALMLPGAEGIPTAILLVAIIAVVWFGHQNSMRAFPWQFLKQVKPANGSILNREIRIDTLAGAPATKAPTNVGWPFLALSPKVQCQSISLLTSLSLSALFGWWSFCIIERGRIEPLPELILFFAVLAALVRLGIYCSGLAPSFNIWGRLVSRRIIVPGFDQVFRTPLAAILLAILGGMLIRRAGVWYPVVESFTLALIWLVLFSGGPTLRNWVLTGQHRFRIPARISANKQMPRSV